MLGHGMKMKKYYFTFPRLEKIKKPDNTKSLKEWNLRNIFIHTCDQKIN